MSLHPNYTALANDMVSTGVVKFGGPFELEDGTFSSFEINTRDMISDPDMFFEATNALGIVAKEGFFSDHDISSLQNHRFLMGMAEASSEYAGAISYAFNIPFLKRRVGRRTETEFAAVDGKFQSGDEVILLDSFVSRVSTTILEEIRYLGQFGIKTVAVIELIDPQQGGRTFLEENGIDFHSILTIKEIADRALRNGRIVENVYDNVIAELDPDEVDGL